MMEKSLWGFLFFFMCTIKKFVNIYVNITIFNKSISICFIYENYAKEIGGGNEMNDILVSIDCITYNHEKYIAEAIESFLMQKTNFKYEILIHDDASTDGTQEIIKEYYEKYPDIIKPLLQRENQYSRGVNEIGYIFNHGRAKGKYVAVCEGDDYWTDCNKLQRQVDYMESHPQCGLCFHAAEKVNDRGGRIDLIRPYYENCISPMEDIILGGGGFMATNTILYRKSVVDNAPDFYLNAPVSDYPLQILSGSKNYAYYINEVMSVYRFGVPGSWSRRMSEKKGKQERMINHIKKIIEMLGEINDYFQGEYLEIIDKRILECEFEILRLQGNWEEIKSSKYRSIYDRQGLKEKMKIYMKCKFPKIYEHLSNITQSLT